MHARFVEDFIDKNQERPFFVYYTMCLTHGPHMPTPLSYKPGMDKFKNDRENFKACVEYVDVLVDRLVKHLEKRGLRENTVLFFAGDNGTGGEGKGQPTELGARVPMIVNCPGIVKPRGATGELTDLSDILPTLMELAGAELPKDRVFDGRSYAAFLRGRTDNTRDWIFSYIGDARILRTKRWLLEDNSPLHPGRLYDCGDSRDSAGYREVSDSTEPEVLEAKKYLAKLLDNLPAPVLPEDGSPTEKKPRRRKTD